ncbi:MAG: co-chaperone DjlA [Pseudomonadota bacterium]
MCYQALIGSTLRHHKDSLEKRNFNIALFSLNSNVSFIPLPAAGKKPIIICRALVMEAKPISGNRGSSSTQRTTMGWFGKIVGGTIGFALGGPLGAIAGAAFGHAFDSSKVQEYPENDDPRLTTYENHQLTFFVAAFSMLAKIAKSDGAVSKEEIDSVEKFMLYDLNLDPESRRVAMTIFHRAIDSPGSFQDFATQFYVMFQSRPQLLELLIDILFRVSVADGALSQREEQLILSAARIFRFSDDQYRQLKSRYAQDPDKHYATLGTSRADSNETIKKQYRKLVSEYHPDKIASKGLPDEFMKFAHEKFRQIQEAYDAIKKERGLN